MSSQPQPAQVEKDEEATLAFGVGRLPALLAAHGVQPLCLGIHR